MVRMWPIFVRWAITSACCESLFLATEFTHYNYTTEKESAFSIQRHSTHSLISRLFTRSTDDNYISVAGKHDEDLCSSFILSKKKKMFIINFHQKFTVFLTSRLDGNCLNIELKFSFSYANLNVQNVDDAIL